MSFQKVEIHYGICTSFHIMEHKPQFVKGLRDRLQKLGYRADLYKVPFINYCVIEMCGHEIFRCNLRNLTFNTYYGRDAVAQRAIAAILAASAKLNFARVCMWTRDQINKNVFVRGPYTPQDYWPQEEVIKPYISCNKCVACCDILVKKESFRTQTMSRCYEFNICSQFDLTQFK